MAAVPVGTVLVWDAFSGSSWGGPRTPDEIYGGAVWNTSSAAGAVGSGYLVGTQPYTSGNAAWAGCTFDSPVETTGYFIVVEFSVNTAGAIAGNGWWDGFIVETYGTSGSTTQSGVNGGSFGGSPNILKMTEGGGSEAVLVTGAPNINDGSVHTISIEVGTTGQRYYFDSGMVTTTSRGSDLKINGIDLYGIFDNCRIRDFYVATMEDPFPPTSGGTTSWHMRENFLGSAELLMDRQPDVREGFTSGPVEDGIIGTWAANGELLDAGDPVNSGMGWVVSGDGTCYIIGEGV